MGQRDASHGSERRCSSDDVSVKYAALMKAQLISASTTSRMGPRTAASSNARIAADLTREMALNVSLLPASSSSAAAQTAARRTRLCSRYESSWRSRRCAIALQPAKNSARINDASSVALAIEASANCSAQSDSDSWIRLRRGGAEGPSAAGSLPGRCAGWIPHDRNRSTADRSIAIDDTRKRCPFVVDSWSGKASRLAMTAVSWLVHGAERSHAGRAVGDFLSFPAVS